MSAEESGRRTRRNGMRRARGGRVLVVCISFFFRGVRAGYSSGKVMYSILKGRVRGKAISFCIGC